MANLLGPEEWAPDWKEEGRKGGRTEWREKPLAMILLWALPTSKVMVPNARWVRCHWEMPSLHLSLWLSRLAQPIDVVLLPLVWGLTAFSWESPTKQFSTRIKRSGKYSASRRKSCSCLSSLNSHATSCEGAVNTTIFNVLLCSTSYLNSFNNLRLPSIIGSSDFLPLLGFPDVDGMLDQRKVIQYLGFKLLLKSRYTA